MHDNRSFISGSKIYTKTTILESVVIKYGDEYTVDHYFKEIVEKNDLIDRSVDEKTNWKGDKLSPDLNDKTTELGYNSYSQQSTSSYWESDEKHLKIKKDMPEIIAMVNNSRYEISKRVFGT